MALQIHIDELIASIGASFGPTDWMLIDQGTIDAFADVTGDDQWIHVNQARARHSSFGGTVAHGLLTLSLVPRLVGQIFQVSGRSMGVNYGYNKVRFPAPIPSGVRVRAKAKLSDAEHRGDAVLTTVTTTIEIESGEKPGCIAEMLVLHLP